MLKNKIEVTTRRPENMTKDIEKFRLACKAHIWDKDTYEEESQQEEKRTALFLMTCTPRPTF